MTAARLLAIDVGTQSARAIVFDAQGNLIAKAQKFFEPTYHSPQPGWAEQDPEIYWQAVTETCQSLWQSGVVKPSEISGIALTTQRATMICLDGAGKVLRPAILWLDQRHCTQPPHMGPYALLPRLPVLGGLIKHFQSEADANWLVQHQPEIWRNTAKYLFLSGFLTQRLVGEYVDSVGCQVGYVPFDYKTLAWAKPSDFKWKAVAIKPGQLPRLVAPGQKLGVLQKSAAEALGLPAGLPLIAAAADKACEVLGCGALEPDVAALSFGTTATINTTQPRYLEVQSLLPAYPAALPGAFNTEIQIYRRPSDPALGAAINLAVGLGLHADYTQAVTQMTRVGARLTPNPEAQRTYDALYREVYQAMYPRLRPLYRRIRTITGYPP